MSEVNTEICGKSNATVIPCGCYTKVIYKQPTDTVKYKYNIEPNTHYNIQIDLSSTYNDLYFGLVDDDYHFLLPDKIELERNNSIVVETGEKSSYIILYIYFDNPIEEKCIKIFDITVSKMSTNEILESNLVNYVDNKLEDAKNNYIMSSSDTIFATTSPVFNIPDLTVNSEIGTYYISTSISFNSSYDFSDICLELQKDNQIIAFSKKQINQNDEIITEHIQTIQELNNSEISVVIRNSLGQMEVYNRNIILIKLY
jgi:hypothetical protein